jgi:hypothetical protein
MSVSRALTAIAALSSVACSAGWERRPLNEPFPSRQQVQVWHRGRADLLHGVSVDSSTVRGTPYHRPLSCDSCLVTIPRAEVDSVRIGDLSNGLWRSVALVGGVVIVSGIIYCLKRDCRGT